MGIVAKGGRYLSEIRLSLGDIEKAQVILGERDTNLRLLESDSTPKLSFAATKLF